MASFPEAAQPLRRVGVGGRTEEFLPDQLTPAAAQISLAAEPVEWPYVFDQADRQVARFRGTTDQVDLSDELKARTGALGLYGDAVLKDHLIVHNHPPRTGSDPVASFPPSPADLAMAVECDLRSLIVLSGDSRYEIRRPGPAWPFDEDVLQELIDDIRAELDAAEVKADATSAGLAFRHRRVLERMNELRFVDYEQVARSSGV